MGRTFHFVEEFISELSLLFKAQFCYFWESL